MNHRTVAITAFAAVVSLMSAGCGTNCQTTCSRIYQENGGCNIERAGTSEQDLMTTCMNTCEGALTNPGEVGDYDPQNVRASSQAITIDTDRQAALWMDCVAVTSCDNLENGYCAPIW